MRSLRRPTVWLLRMLQVGLGLTILLTIAPMQQPWFMERVSIGLCDSTPCVRVRPVIGDGVFDLPTTAILLALVMAAVLSMVLDTAIRRRLFSLLRHGRSARSVVIAMGALLLTMIPSDRGGGIVLYLFLGSLGLFWTVRGLIAGPHLPLAAQLGAKLLNATNELASSVMRVPSGWFLACAFGLAFVITNWISLAVFQHIPHAEDNIAQLFHARVFAGGSLTAPLPPLPDFFSYPHMIQSDRWYSQYPPGFIAILALGVLFNAPWVINPLLGSATLVALYFLAKEIYDERVARLTVLLGLICPFLLFMSSGFMNHAASLFAGTLAYLFFARSLRGRLTRDAVLAGLCIGWMVSVRPLSAFAVASPLVAIAAWKLFSKPRIHAATLLTMLAVALLPIALLLAYNYETNGSALLFGYEALYGPGHSLGFGHSGWGPPHSPALGALHTLRNLNAINKFLLEWPIPGLFFVAVLFASRRARSWDFCLLASFLALPFAYFFYWFQDWCFGPRFLYEAVGFLLMLNARGMLVFASHMTAAGSAEPAPEAGRGALALMTALSLAIGWSANVDQHIEYYGDSYWDVDADTLQRIEAAGLRDAIVVTRANYGGVFHALDPWLRGPVIVARDLGPRNHELAQSFPERTLWLVDDDGVRPVSAGTPWPVEELPPR